MNSFEAVQALASRARRTARWGWALGVGALGLLFGGLLTVMVLSGTPAKAAALAAAYASIGAGALLVPGIHFGVRQYLRLRRTRWIDELARQEGLDAKKLAESFTLDSW